MAVSSLLAVAGVGAASIYQGSQAQKAQKRAANQARTDAQNAQRQADQAFNKANPKDPNVAALFKRNTDASSSGVGGTFLTGSGGAPVSSGMLGRSTLLGR